MAKNKQYVAVVKITDSLKLMIPLLHHVPEQCSYCAVVWDDTMILRAFDYFGEESHLNLFTAKVKLDSDRLGFIFLDVFPEPEPELPHETYGTLIEKNVDVLRSCSDDLNVLVYIENALPVARRNIRDALTYEDTLSALSDYEIIMSLLAKVKLNNVEA